MVPKARDDAHQRRLCPGAAELRTVSGRERREPDHGDCRVEQDDEADCPEEAPGKVASRPTRLLREVRHGLEARVGEHRERQREREVVPCRRRAERRAAGQRAAGEEQREPEHDEQQLGDQVDERDHEREAEEAPVPKQPVRRDAGDHEASEHQVPRLLHRREHGRRGVVRDIERGERDHDQVVEEERPAGDKPPEVVEGDPDERRRAAGLADRGRAFCV